MPTRKLSAVKDIRSGEKVLQRALASLQDALLSTGIYLARYCLLDGWRWDKLEDMFIYMHNTYDALAAFYVDVYGKTPGNTTSAKDAKHVNTSDVDKV